jgi:hypothetical protein
MGLLGLGLLALGGCVDMFTEGPIVAAPRWTGTTTAGPAEIAECAPMAVDVAIVQDPLYLFRQLDGRAHPTVRPTAHLPRATAAVTTWWAEGYANPDDFVQFETRRQRPIYFRAKPYAVWRGNIVEDKRIVLEESGSPCNRSLTLDRN